MIDDILLMSRKGVAEEKSGYPGMELAFTEMRILN